LDRFPRCVRLSAPWSGWAAHLRLRVCVQLKGKHMCYQCRGYGKSVLIPSERGEETLFGENPRKERLLASQPPFGMTKFGIGRP